MKEQNKYKSDYILDIHSQKDSTYSPTFCLNDADLKERG